MDLSGRGGLTYTPSERALAWAHEECERGDAEKCNSMEHLSTVRWMGLLGEWYFARWLKDSGVASFTRNGGNDPLPDFIVYGVGVGLKTPGAKDDFTPRHRVEIFEYHRKVSPDHLFFVGHVGLDHPRAMVMLGGIDTGDFFRRAEWVPKGAHLNASTVSRADTWRLRVGELRPPEAWLDDLRERLPQLSS